MFRAFEFLYVMYNASLYVPPTLLPTPFLFLPLSLSLSILFFSPLSRSLPLPHSFFLLASRSPSSPQRSDYLHHKMYEALSDYPNIYFPTWRMATIWGGASLLQMLLRALEDLEFVLTNWKWDYFINLSESDYPLK